jgi:hypothetical protein
MEFARNLGQVPANSRSSGNRAAAGGRIRGLDKTSNEVFLISGMRRRVAGTFLKRELILYWSRYVHIPEPIQAGGKP